MFTLVRPGGAIVSAVVHPNDQLASPYGVRSDYLIVDVEGARLAEIAAMFENGQLTIPVGSVLPLCAARAAHEMMASSRPHSRGNIVWAVES